ncbi:hypothetical protein Pcinc_008325 [Petrolisthes cinctipes]|uniref:Uncharacterized protein n=1 Tax=Petrolisthes cinctipes TaxID=88211 RepID=A0AAE1G974_PETCI|nr:hypothetical protein Pcinc_008325 [Petrolisthes cinctipes]
MWFLGKRVERGSVRTPVVSCLNPRQQLLSLPSAVTTPGGRSLLWIQDRLSERVKAAHTPPTQPDLQQTKLPIPTQQIPLFHPSEFPPLPPPSSVVTKIRSNPPPAPKPNQPIPPPPHQYPTLILLSLNTFHSPKQHPNLPLPHQHDKSAHLLLILFPTNTTPSPNQYPPLTSLHPHSKYLPAPLNLHIPQSIPPPKQIKPLVISTLREPSCTQGD